LEIGSFLGAVSISLKNIGYNVSALEIPEYCQSSSFRALYNKNNIPLAGVNLRKYQLPYESGSFDVVIACAVIEHLNFNPLPVLEEINRVLKKGGYFYIGMPNQLRISRRIRLLLGNSIHNPIAHFFSQLNRQDNMIVGLHWREYTLDETVQMIEQMGFETIKKYYFVIKQEFKGTKKAKSLVKKLPYLIPTFRPQFTVIGKKVSEPINNFWRTEANC